MPIQPSSCGMVRWSVSKPRRGRCCSTRSASYARIPAGGPACCGVRLQVGARQEEVAAVRRLAYGDALRHVGDRPGGQVDDRELRGAVGDLDPVEELHRLQVGEQRALRAGLDVGPDRLAVVDQVERVLDVAVRGEDQRLGGLAGGEVARRAG